MLSNQEQWLPLQERQRIHVDLSWKNEDAQLLKMASTMKGLKVTELKAAAPTKMRE